MLESVFGPDEVASLLDEVKRMSADPSIVSLEEAITEPGSDAVRSIFRVHELSDMLGRLASDPRLIHVARQILGSEVYMHQSRANMKPGFKGKEFYWHRSEEHTSELQSLMRISYAVFCLKKKNLYTIIYP